VQPSTAGRERWPAHCRPMEKRKLKKLMAGVPPIGYPSHVISYGF
jgi:hypothetical protein